MQMKPIFFAEIPEPSRDYNLTLLYCAKETECLVKRRCSAHFFPS